MSARFTEDDVTEWFPPSVRPTIEGNYELIMDPRPYFRGAALMCFWNGIRFVYGSEEFMERVRANNRHFPTCAELESWWWRGLKKPAGQEVAA